MKILKEGGIYLSSSLLEKSIPFLLMPFLTRVLSTEQYGLIAIFISTVSVYGLFVGANLNGFVRVVYHKTSIKKFKSYVGNTLTIICILTLIVLFFTWIFERYISEFIKIESKYLYLAIFVAFLKFLIDMRLVIFQTMRQAYNYAKLQLCYPVIELLFVIFFVFYLHKGAVGRISSITISTLLAAGISAYLLYRSKLLNIFINLKYMKRIAKFIFPLVPHSIALTVITTFDKFILSSYVGLSIVGELAVALTLAYPIWMLAESINKAFMPWSFHKFREGRIYEVVGASYLILIGLFVVGIVYSTFLLFTFEIIVDEKFKDVLNPALILLWAGWLKLAYYLFAKGLVYSEKMKFLPLISISSGCIYFGLIFMNIENITLVSMSFYINIFYSFMFLGTLILSQIIYPQPWGNFSSILKVLKITYKNIEIKK